MKPLAEITITIGEIGIGVEKPNAYRILFRQGDKHAALQSEEGDLENKDERRFLLDGLFTNLQYFLRRTVFPNDTKICDLVHDEFGKKAINCRYPDEK